MSNYKQSYTEEQIDRLIAERFSVALMNDSKWERLLGRLTTTFEGGVHIAYKLIHSDKIRQTTLTSPDFKPFFTEPTLYREIEWLEFTSRYEACVNQTNKKSGVRICDQDIPAIESQIHRFGVFQFDHVATGLRLYAYK